MGKPGRRTTTDTRAVREAMRIDWRGMHERQLLRESVTHLRDSLEGWAYSTLTLPSLAGTLGPVSARGTAEALLALLLDLQAVDLLGIASLLRDGRKRRRRAPRPRGATPIPEAPAPQ